MLTGFFVIFLPLLEIAGFIIIGGEIGVGKSILWVIAAIIAGFYCLTTMGTTALMRVKQSIDDDIYPLEQLFDGFSILIGSFLLILPGFISDFIALVFLVPLFRRGLFLFLKSQHGSVLQEFTKKAEGVNEWYSEKTDSRSSHPTIEGEFRVIKKKDEDEESQ